MTKQDLYTYLKTTLGGLAAFKTVERWKDQIQFSKTALPACLIQFESIDITRITGLGANRDVAGVLSEVIVQNLKFQITFHFYQKTFEDNVAFTGIYDREQQVYLALQGQKSNDQMTPLVRVGIEEGDQLDRLDSCRTMFECVITDDSALSGKTVKNTTLPAVITRGTV